jgi:ATP-dependent DNA helicase RecG
VSQSQSAPATIDLARLADWMSEREGEHLEFKEARQSYDFDKVVRYVAALANEGGGWLILGVTDKVPRQVVGTRAFSDLGRLKLDLLTRLRLRIEVTQLIHPEGRVLVVSAPSRPRGVAIEVDGRYLMRAGESLVGMSADHLKRIFDELTPDVSAELIPGATLDDLDPASIATFRARWALRSRRPDRMELAPATLLEDAELLDNGRVTLAALVLLGSPKAVSRHLAQAEVIFEYRGQDGAIAFEERQTYREGFLGFHDRLWGDIQRRNTVHSYLDGLFRNEIQTFNESAVREAILNAVSHRDYRSGASVFVKVWPTRLDVVSPGGFPEGITPENLINRQNPRNRRLAESLEKCGLVERSGQGADRMYSSALSEGKTPPDYSASDAHQVALTLDGRVRDEKFLKFLARLSAETQRPLVVHDLLVMDAVRANRPIPPSLRDRVEPLIQLGALERRGRGQFLLSARFYEFAGEPAEYTRRRGLDRESKKALLLRHLELAGPTGAPISELQEVLPDSTRDQLRVFLRELRESGRAVVIGERRGARWVAAVQP